MKTKRLIVNIITGANKCKVKPKERDKFYHIRCNGYETIIPKLYVSENELVIHSGSFRINNEMFARLFKESIVSKQVEQQRITEREKRLKEIDNSFYPYVPLFWENREMILKDPRFYSVKSPRIFMGSQFGTVSITLGQLLQMWETERDLLSDCSCGGVRGVFFSSGSLLSGNCTHCFTVCLKCGSTKDEKEKFTGMGSKTSALNKYPPIKPVCREPASYEELIAVCKGNRQKI